MKRPAASTTQPLRRSERCAKLQNAARDRDSFRASPSCEEWADNLNLKEDCQQPADVPANGPGQHPTLGQHASLAELGRASDQSGLWGLLPEELLEDILNRCTTQQLGMLEASCTFFRKSGAIDRIAKQRLKVIPRARGLKPNKKEGERHLALLHFVNSQSAAAAQATAVACGAHHTAALLVSAAVEMATTEASKDCCKHALYTFGRGFYGQLGTDSRVDSNQPSVSSLGFRTCPDNAAVEEETMPAVVSCGSNYSCSISRRGELFTWGLGSSGELGLGQWAPLEVPRPRQCFSTTRIVSIAAGSNHTLAIAENGSLWSCGKGRQGQLGQGHLQDVPRLTKITSLESLRVVSAAAGVAHSMALAADGSLYTWGDGRCGQLGHNSLQGLATMIPNQMVLLPAPQKITRLDPGPLAPENRVTAIAAGAYHSMALTVGGMLLAFGKNDHGALGTGDTANRWKPTKVELESESDTDTLCKRVVQVACGAGHTVALVSNGGSLEVRSTGCNAWGQLGTGDRKERHVFTRTILKVSGVVAVQSGDEHSMAITSSGQLFVWGRGDSGQLGLGDARAKWKPTLLKDFKVVHPDKTLRRNKRSMPNTRPVEDSKRPRLDDAIRMQ